MGTTARLVRRAGTHTVWLEVDYDGLEPPTALFADLTMLGWRPPAAASPPHDAIDWSVPDRERGLDHTIRPWRVVGASVGPPPGSGPRGSWTQADADAALGLLARVLQRHQVAHDGQQAGAAADPPAPAATPTSTPTAAPRTGSLVCFVVEADQAPTVRQDLERVALPFRTATATLSVPQRYRGREFVTEVPGVRFEVATHGEATDQLRRDLAALGVDERLSRLTIEPLEPGGADDAHLAEVHPFRRTRGVA